MSTYKLRTIGPPHEVFMLKTGAYRLGSASDSEMVIGDMSVAPYHCEIVVTGKTISVRNLSSTQEMHVDGQLVQSSSLNLGQTLKLGNVTLILEEPAEAAAASSASGGHAQPAAVAVVKRSAQLLRPYVLPGLAFLGVASIAVLIWLSTREDSRKGPAVPVAKPPRVKPKQTEEKAGTAASEKSDASEGAESEGKPSRSPGAAASKPAREKPGKPNLPFNPNDATVPPAVDIETADGHLEQRDFRRAQPYIQRALMNQAKSLGPDHPEVAKTIDKLGRSYQDSGEFAKAEPCFKQVLNSVEKNRGPEHPQTAAAMNNLGGLYLAEDEPGKAAPFLEQALKIREKALGAGHPDVGASLTNLAAMNLAEGELGKAVPQLERALKNFETNFGAKHPAVAQCLTDLGATHHALNEDSKAESFLQRALELKEQNLPPDDPALLPALNNLAAVEVAKGDFAKAETLLERGLKNAEKNFGPDDPKTAESLDKLAELHQQKGDPAKALPLAERAEKIDEKAAGPDSPETAESLDKVAKLHQALNDAAQAKPLLERSSNVLAKALGPEHPRSQKNLEDLADLKACEGDQTQGPQLAKQAIRGKVRLLTTFLSYASEPQRLAADDLLNPYSLAAFINSAPEMALAVLRYKGVVLDSLLEDRLLVQSGRDPKDQAMIGELFSLRGKMAALHFGVAEDLSSKAQEQRQSEKNKMAKDVEVLESILGHRLAGLGRARNAVNATVEQVQSAIPAQAVLLELVRYSRCLSADKWEPCYGAVILTSTGNSIWVPLGSAEAIDGNIERVQNAVRTRRESPEQASKASEELAAILQALAKQLWTPVEALIPAGVKTLIVCPDGALNFMPYATLLLPDDQFLGQKYSVRYVASGRDLLAEKKSARRGQALIFCNADFAARGLSAIQASGSGPASISFPARRDLEALRLTPLPGTLGEAALAEAFIKRLNAPVQVLGGAGASEAQLAAVQSPRILHLATHAFALPDNGRGEGQVSRPVKRARPASDSEKLLGAPAASGNPVHRSGFALAGAQTTLQAWGRSEIPVASQDGIVTAAEVGTLKLAGTELVVLSGCDARMGGARGGEELLALRRGFVQAGAENLLMTLWPAADPATIEMIGNFYERMQQPGGVAKAFTDVQRESMVRLRKDRGLETAVRLAGAFVLSSQGR